jgi:hypothetical protein
MSTRLDGYSHAAVDAVMTLWRVTNKLKNDIKIGATSDVETTVTSSLPKLVANLTKALELDIPAIEPTSTDFTPQQKRRLKKLLSQLK